MSRHPKPIVQELRDRGLRATAPRHAVLEWLISHPHATAEQVHDGVSERLGTISKQAVYDVLSACMDANLVRQIKPAGHPARFERRAGDNHHHLVCRRCDRIEDTDCRVHTMPCLTPEHDCGFDIDEAEVVFWGLCTDCQCISDHANSGHTLDTHTQSVDDDGHTGPSCIHPSGG